MYITSLPRRLTANTLTSLGVLSTNGAMDSFSIVTGKRYSPKMNALAWDSVQLDSKEIGQIARQILPD